jgi:hypothetical protein
VTTFKDDLEGVVGFIEANSFEQHSIYKEALEAKRTYVGQTSGYILQAGTFHEYDVWVSVTFATISGQRLAFYYPTSRYVDYELVRKWIESVAPESAKEDGRLVHSDGMNWHNALRRERATS